MNKRRRYKAKARRAARGSGVRTVERLLGTQEVAGSIPAGSSSFATHAEVRAVVARVLAKHRASLERLAR